MHCSNGRWKRTVHFNRLKPARIADTDNEEFEEKHGDSDIDTQGREVNTHSRNVDVKPTDDEVSATSEPNVGDEVLTEPDPLVAEQERAPVLSDPVQPLRRSTRECCPPAPLW